MFNNYPKLLLLFLLLLVNANAYAHAVLEYSEPARRAILYRAPEQVVLTFNEAVEVEFSKIILMDDNDNVVVKNQKVRNIYNKNSIGIALPELSSGTYFVQFQVLSIDGHKVKGRYKFIIKDNN